MGGTAKSSCCLQAPHSEGVGGGLLAHPSCSQMGMEVHGFPSSNEGRQAERSELPEPFPQLSMGAQCWPPLGPEGGWPFSTMAASRPPCL